MNWGTPRGFWGIPHLFRGPEFGDDYYMFSTNITPNLITETFITATFITPAPLNAVFHWYADHAATIFGICISVAVVGELIGRWARGRDMQAQSTITSIVSGATFMVVKTLIGKAAFLALSLYLYHHVAPTHLNLSNPLIWIGVFLIRDFVYYWVHRAEHTFRALWASHLVHHSPETIGMATAVRVPWMEALYKPFFGLWLPLIGFNPLAAIAFDVFAATLSQLQHTEAFPAAKNSIIGKIFVTPSSHRVHHGYNPEYIDKNYGAVLIIWDRMFGTYAPEVAPVKFGVGETDAVVTVRDALVGGFPRLAADMASMNSKRGALQVALSRPGSPLPAPT